MPSKLLALDYSERIPASAIVQAGYKHVIRYLGNPDNWPKAMTEYEVMDLRNHQLIVHLNYEQTADFMLAGYNGGIHFATEARRWATSLGFSVLDTIYYSADFDANPTQLIAILDFLDGAAYQEKGKGFVGCYGGIKTIGAAINHGYGGWQAGAWSYGQRDSRAFAWQDQGTVTIAGVQCDVNELNSNYQQGTTTMSNTIPQSIRDKWPAIAGQFTGTYDDSIAIIWADAGARYAAQRADDIMNKLNELEPPQGVSLTANDIDAIATAVAKKLGSKLSA